MFQKQSNVWSKTLKNKSIVKYHRNICIEICKWKFNQVRLVLAVFASTKLALNYIKQAQCN